MTYLCQGRTYTRNLLATLVIVHQSLNSYHIAHMHARECICNIMYAHPNCSFCCQTVVYVDSDNWMQYRGLYMHDITWCIHNLDSKERRSSYIANSTPHDTQMNPFLGVGERGTNICNSSNARVMVTNNYPYGSCYNDQSGMSLRLQLYQVTLFK